MIISTKWLRRYLSDDYSIDELSERIGSRLVEIESIQNLSEKYHGAVVVRVAQCVKHPDSDHLHVCQIDDGGVSSDVPRDKDGLVQVVCGAPNVHTGMLAVWLPVGMVVPETYGRAKEVKLGARKLRGVKSYGMLASPRELDLWNDQEGILDVGDEGYKVGQSLIEVLELDDYLLEVENKSLTHRPDCFGLIGFAREVAAIFGGKAHIPAWFSTGTTSQTTGNAETIKPTVTIENAHLCQRYECVVLDNVAASSQLPLTWRSMIGRSGSNSISAPVDITNLVMYETGQPLHAFDLDKLIELSPTKQPDLIVRAAKVGEKLTLIDGRELKLDPADIIIAVGDKSGSLPVALAGAMGGQASEITSATRRILLESATFDLYHLRSTQFRHGVFSEAITRFTKGQPAELTAPALDRAIELFSKYTGATVASAVIDSYPHKWYAEKFDIPVQKFSAVLGDYSKGGYGAKLIESTLSHLGYEQLSVNGDNISGIVPWWRPDQHIDEDIIEDVGRVNGFDNIATRLPSRPYTAAPYDSLLQAEDQLKDRLRMAGGNEVITYSFIHGDLLDAVHDDKANAFKIINAISPNLQYYRRDLLPGLLPIASANLRSGYDKFLLFEVGKVHRRGLMDHSEPDLPREINELSGVLVSKKDSNASAYYQIKHILEFALNIAQARIKLTRLDQYGDKLDSSVNLFEPTRSAVILIDGEYAGVMGEVKADVRAKFKLPRYLAGFSLLITPVTRALGSAQAYHPVPKYPGTTRDITYQVSSATDYQTIYDNVRIFLEGKRASTGYVFKVEPLDIYQVDANTKNITLRLSFIDPKGTIDTKRVNNLLARLASGAKQLNAKVI